MNTFLHYTFAEVGYVEVGGIRESIYVRRWARWGGLSRVTRALTYNFRPLPVPVPLGRALAAVANFVGFDLGVGLVCRVGSSVGVGESSCVGV